VKWPFHDSAGVGYTFCYGCRRKFLNTCATRACNGHPMPEDVTVDLQRQRRQTPRDCAGCLYCKCAHSVSNGKGMVRLCTFLKGVSNVVKRNRNQETYGSTLCNCVGLMPLRRHRNGLFTHISLKKPQCCNTQYRTLHVISGMKWPLNPSVFGFYIRVPKEVVKSSNTSGYWKIGVL